MQADGRTRFSQYRLTGLAVTIALAVGILAGGQVDVAGALPDGFSTRHESAAPSARAVTPHFIVSDGDGLYHQQRATAVATTRCGATGSPVFIGGDVDGLANPAVDAAIPTAGCDGIAQP